MFGILSRRRRAGQTNEALTKLQGWTRAAWPNHWHASDMTDLQAELDVFLPEAMAHAQEDPNLKGAYSAMITRFILLGVTGSGTHDDSELEAALGVPMPTEAAR